MARSLEEKRDSYLKKKYGISLVQYNEMFKKQNGCCAICNKPPKENKNFNVDHCHETNVVRGLLCWYCNKIIVGRISKKHVKPLISYLISAYIRDSETI